MERSGKRGKIPQQDWPSIIDRYEKGETLASIARTYDCSPPAISYILSRSRARSNAAAVLAAAPAADDKSDAPPQEDGPRADPAPVAAPAALGETAQRPGNGIAWPSRGDSANGADPPAPRSSVPRDPAAPTLASARLAGEGVPRDIPSRGSPAMVARGPQEEARRTLHLSHGRMNGPERPPAGQARGPEAYPRDIVARGPQENGDASPGARMPAPHPAPAEPLYPQPARQPVGQPSGSAYAPGNGAPLRVLAEPQPHPREGGAIDEALRTRVRADLAAFLAAFDAALAEDTSESRAGLREATDRLLRAGARTRIELERLEARLPLPARDTLAAAPAWRQR